MKNKVGNREHQKLLRQEIRISVYDKGIFVGTENIPVPIKNGWKKWNRMSIGNTYINKETAVSNITQVVKNVKLLSVRMKTRKSSK